MIFAKTSVGVEIAGRDLRLAVVRSNFGKLRLLALHQISGFLELSEDEQKKSIQTLFKNAHIPTARVYFAVSREQGIVRQIDLPADIGQKLADVVKLQVETLSPWTLNEVYWDFAKEPQKKNQKLATVTIAIIARTILDPWIAFFKAAGVPLSGAILSSMAYGHGASALWAGHTPTLILHHEGSSVEGVVVNDNRIAAMTDSSDEGVSRSLVDRLFSVAKLSSGDASRLIVCGSQADTFDLQDNPLLPLENAKQEATLNFGAIATALLPLKESPYKANLIPRDLRYRQGQLRFVPTYVLGLLAVGMGLALLAREPYQNGIYASQLNSEIQKIAPQVREVAAQEAELNQLSDRYRALALQLQSHDYNLEALRELARILPESAFISSYAYQDGNITISGFAQSASEIQNLLETSPVFKGVEFTNSVTRDPTGKDRFTLRMTIEAAK